MSLSPAVSQPPFCHYRQSARSRFGSQKGCAIVAAAAPAYPRHLPELAAARDRQVVVYCATSGGSAMAVAVMQMMGFRNVLNLDGGYLRWVAEGMPQEHEATF